MAAKCTREIGSPRKGWHECGATAAYEIIKQGRDSVWSQYACHAHLEAMTAHDPVAAKAGIRIIGQRVVS
jgi:hypothetical protein